MVKSRVGSFLSEFAHPGPVVTVENQRRLVSTVVFEYFLAQITVAGAGFVGYDCHQAMKKHQKLQYLKDFFLLLLSV